MEARCRIQLDQGRMVCFQRPAVDVMFGSFAEAAGRHTIAAPLTGMGADGARGMNVLLERSAHTIAQDELSCVVYGMPREAVRLGAAEKIAPLKDTARKMLMAAQHRSRQLVSA